jgi:hypothetical protein
MLIPTTQLLKCIYDVDKNKRVNRAKIRGRTITLKKITNGYIQFPKPHKAILYK